MMRSCAQLIIQRHSGFLAAAGNLTTVPDFTADWVQTSYDGVNDRKPNDGEKRNLEFLTSQRIGYTRNFEESVASF